RTGPRRTGPSPARRRRSPGRTTASWRFGPRGWARARRCGPLRVGEEAHALLRSRPGPGRVGSRSGPPFSACPGEGPLRRVAWLAVSFLLAALAHAQIGTVLEQHKISSVAGNFAGPLHDGDNFGMACAPLGDLDGDGVLDVAV